MDNPLEAPPDESIDKWFEAIMIATIITPIDYAKGVTILCEEKRG